MILLGLAAAAMILPLGLAFWYGEEGMVRVLGCIVAAVLAAALPALFFTRKRPIRFSAADGFLLVFLGWVAVCLLGAAPFYFARQDLSFSAAVFESVSGFTTTGATIIADTEALPRSLLFWRALTHWLGGMGIVVLTVALLPLLGLEGYRQSAGLLANAETPGPEKSRITPRMSAHAKLLWLIYLALTAAESILLRLGGMGWFDAVTHSFATIATGGFSTRNNSIAAFNSPWIHWVCLVFMLLSGFNFSLLFSLIRGKFRDIRRNSEAKAYGLIVLTAAGIIFLSLRPRGLPPEETLRTALFHTASVLTTTGFSLADHNAWPPLAQGVLFFLMFIGGCSGSTAGGVKVIRYVVLFKQGGNELKRLLYPKGVFSIRLNKKPGRKDVVYGVAGFLFLYLVLVFAAALLACLAGEDLFSSFNIGLLTLGNIGLGLGQFSGGLPFSGFPPAVLWGLSFIMIAGRLELWTALVFFSRYYWRA
jgi:trk system potassium uptake protein TrkH